MNENRNVSLQKMAFQVHTDSRTVVSRQTDTRRRRIEYTAIRSVGSRSRRLEFAELRSITSFSKLNRHVRRRVK